MQFMEIWGFGFAFVTAGMIFRTIIYASLVSFSLNIIAFVFAKGGSIIEYLAHWIVNGIVVCIILFPYWYIKLKQNLLSKKKFILHIVLGFLTAFSVSWFSLVLFYVLSVEIYGPPY